MNWTVVISIAGLLALSIAEGLVVGWVLANRRKETVQDLTQEQINARWKAAITSFMDSPKARSLKVTPVRRAKVRVIPMSKSTH